jgi:type IV pilus assembly protein PilA
MPMFANRFYFRHAQKKIDKITATTSSVEQQSIQVARIGGTSSVALVVIPFILVFVLGILAAIAIPAYQDYTIRAQVSEGLNLSGYPKAAVTEYFGDVGEYPENNQAAGLAPASELSGKYVASIAIIDGDVLITYGGQANQVLDGKTLVMHPALQGDGVIDWSCRSESIAPKHLPAACR